MASGAIPCYLLEEHHEAFFVWNCAVRQGVLPPTGNTILHLDEHADMGSPRLHRPLPPVGHDPQELWRTTFDELSCFEFLVPVIYQGLVDEQVWVRQTPPPVPDMRTVVSSLGGGGRTLLTRNAPADPADDPTPAPPDARAAVYRMRSIEAGVPSADALILDVDLDYFSCEDAVNVVQRLEITPDEYARWRDDRYHFLRINQGSRIRVAEEGGRHFVYLKHYPERAPTPLRVAEDEIVARVERVGAALEAAGARPRLVCFARSRLSGYTPADQWQFIETTLLARLARLYDLDVKTLADLRAEVA